MLQDVIATLPDGEVMGVYIGLHWTAVVVQVDGQRRCGLASTAGATGGHIDAPDVPAAGQLHTVPARQMAEWVFKDQPMLISVGMAAINALLPGFPGRWHDENAGDVLARLGRGKTVALVGHFPFIDQLRRQVAELHVLELNPRPGDRPAADADTVIPAADVIAITSTTFLNRTLDGLLALRRPETPLLLLGPTTPLSPVLFDYGIDWLSGSVVAQIEPVLQAIMQGAHFRQVHRAGVRLVTMARDGFGAG